MLSLFPPLSLSLSPVIALSIFVLSDVSSDKRVKYDSTATLREAINNSKPEATNSSDRLYAQNPVFEVVREESVKIYVHMYNGNVQQNPLCVESCVTKEFSISPRFSPTIFDPDANSVLLRAHLCTAVDSMRRKSCVRNCSREREGLYNGNVQQNSSCAASCVTKDIPISPRFSPTIFYRDANPVLLLAHLCTAVLMGSMRRTLCSKLFVRRA